MLVSLILAPLVGCLGNKGTPASDTPPAGSTVIIQAFQFMPANLVVKAGTTVTFINEDPVPHTVSPDANAQFTGLEVLDGQSTGSITFDVPGVQHYHCNIHTSMTGTITVQ